MLLSGNCKSRSGETLCKAKTSSKDENRIEKNKVVHEMISYPSYSSYSEKISNEFRQDTTILSP